MDGNELLKDAVMEAKVDIHKLHDQLQSHQLKMSGMRVVEVALFLGLLLAFYINGVKQQAAAMAKFDTLYAQYQTDTQKTQTEMKASYEARLTESKKQTDEANKQVTIVAGIASRNAKAARDTHEVTQTDRTLQQVAEDAHEHLGVLPTVEPDNLLGFPKESVQVFNATAIDNNRLKDNLASETTLYESAQSQFESSKKNEASLKTDLDKQKGLTTECNTALDALKNVKKPSKFKAALGKVGLVSIGIAIGKAAAVFF
jgi:hypothetical protein